MAVKSWYDQGARLSVVNAAEVEGVVVPTAEPLKPMAPSLEGATLVFKSKPEIESWYDNGVRLINLPAGITAKAASANPELAEKAMAYQAKIDDLKARMAPFGDRSGTMVGTRADAP